MSHEDRDTPVTLLLERAAAGEACAAERLFPLVYEQLRLIARQRMAGERRDHTLQATALVHEAYIRLVQENPIGWSSRAQFYHAAGRAMQQLLVEHARARGRLKRGGDGEGRAARRVPLDLTDVANNGDPEEILALDEAVGCLEREDPEVASVVRMRFFAGLTGDETAAALGLSPRQVDRLWAYARAFLFQKLRGDDRDS
ncbi:MAG TPA: ECF-type sigma factor [Phycisphaerae bacterium]|jgi:RNA polymerase sigma factor (TIGR02999 family)